MSENTPLACSLGALSPEEQKRRQLLADQLLTAQQELCELPSGYALRYPAESSLILAIAEFMTLERRCCPFIHFTLECEAEDGPLWLKLTGRAGVKAFLQAELGLDSR